MDGTAEPGRGAAEPTATSAGVGSASEQPASGAAEPTAISTARARSALAYLWERQARPRDVVAAIEALLGLPINVTAQFVGALVATSHEAEHLLDELPTSLRSLAISTTSKTERCVGSVRGPVLWHETMSARSATAGDPGLFVCATPARAYDTDENRVLVAALQVVHKAGLDVNRIPQRSYDDDVLRRARHNAGRASRFLEHRSLTGVPRQRPTKRALQRTRAGNRRHVYAPAVAMIERAAEPVTVDHLTAFCDERTVAQHDLVAALVKRLEASGRPLPPFHTDNGVLIAGPLRYRHPQLRDAGSGLHGLELGPLVVDVPRPLAGAGRSTAEEELARRAPGRPTMVVFGPSDVRVALERAVELGLDLAR